MSYCIIISFSGLYDQIVVKLRNLVVGREVATKLHKGSDEPHSLLRPFEISPNLFRRLHSIGEVSTGALEPSLSHRLEFHQLALFSIQFTRSISRESATFKQPGIRPSWMRHLSKHKLTFVLGEPNSYPVVMGSRRCSVDCSSYQSDQLHELQSFHFRSRRKHCPHSFQKSEKGQLKC